MPKPAMRHDVNLDMDASASAAAVSFGMGDALFKDLAIGDCFHFRNDAVTQVKTASGYRAASGGPTFRTGQRAAVFRAT